MEEVNNEVVSEFKKSPQQKYRENHREQYNHSQRELYNKLKQDEEWKKKFNERALKNNAIHRQRIKEKLLADPNYEPKKRGRPAKTKVDGAIMEGI